MNELFVINVEQPARFGIEPFFSRLLLTAWTRANSLALRKMASLLGGEFGRFHRLCFVQHVTGICLNNGGESFRDAIKHAAGFFDGDNRILEGWRGRVVRDALDLGQTALSCLHRKQPGNRYL